MNNFAVHLKLTQYCKSTIAQKKKKNQHNKLFKLGDEEPRSRFWQTS